MVVVGYSLSPGGLLLPYHLGALDALQYHHFLDDTTPIAGSSAGAYILLLSMDCLSNVLVDDFLLGSPCERTMKERLPPQVTVAR